MEEKGEFWENERGELPKESLDDRSSSFVKERDLVW